MHIVETTCAQEPVNAIVLAVYKKESWA